MHGVRLELLDNQAENLGLPLHKLMSPEIPSMENYNNMMRTAMSNFKQQGVNYSIFGDIFLEDLRLYREEQLKEVNMQAVFPLWKLPTHELMKEFLTAGFKAIIVCVNDKFLDKSFIGRIIDHDFLNDLPADVDPCGENGEYHSFVFNGPIFKHPVRFTIGEIVHKEYLKEKDESEDHSIINHDTSFYYCDLLPN